MAKKQPKKKKPAKKQVSKYVDNFIIKGTMDKILKASVPKK